MGDENAIQRLEQSVKDLGQTVKELATKMDLKLSAQDLTLTDLKVGQAEMKALRESDSRYAAQQNSNNWRWVMFAVAASAATSTIFTHFTNGK